MNDCLFCAIIRKDRSAQEIYRDERCVAFLDIFPRSMGHALVVPARHMATLSEAAPDELGPLWRGVQEVIRRLSDALSPDGFTIGINHGKVSGQVVEHLHIHVIPRFSGDGGGSIHSVVNNPPEESLDAVRQTIVRGE